MRAAQLIRFSIPGAVFLLLFGTDQIILELSWGHTLRDIAGELSGAAPLLAVVVSSLPLGFLVYQAYFFMFGPTFRVLNTLPAPRLQIYVRADRGNDILCKLGSHKEAAYAILGRELHELPPSYGDESVGKGQDRKERVGKWLNLRKLPNHELLLDPLRNRRERVNAIKEARMTYETEAEERWNSCSSLMDLVGGAAGGEHLRRSTERLGDIYHTLGATKAAVVISWLIFLLYNLLAHRTDIGHDLVASAFATAASTVMAVMLLYVCHSNRRHTLSSQESRMVDSIRWYLLKAPG